MGCSEMKLSIILPVYNMQAYLERCLDSVVAALDGLKYTAEVLIINDGSTDRSAQIIAEYCEKYSYMHQYDKKNGGYVEM